MDVRRDQDLGLYNFSRNVRFSRKNTKKGGIKLTPLQIAPWMLLDLIGEVQMRWILCLKRGSDEREEWLILLRCRDNCCLVWFQ